MKAICFCRRLVEKYGVVLGTKFQENWQSKKQLSRKKIHSASSMHKQIIEHHILAKKKQEAKSNDELRKAKWKVKMVKKGLNQKVVCSEHP